MIKASSRMISFVVAHVGGIDFSHLLFADGSLIFCVANPNHLCQLHYLFLYFEPVLSLKINLAKPKLVPVGNVDHVDRLACILSCGVSSLPLKYLSLIVEGFL